MATPDDVFFCVFRLLMQRQAEVFGDDPPNIISEELAKEINTMRSTYTFFEVAILYELANWMRENHYRWECSDAMKHSLIMFLLGITGVMPEMQRPEAWTPGPWETDPAAFALTIPAGAFDLLEDLLEDHWFTLLWNRHCEVDRTSMKKASFGHIDLNKGR